jgi:hypothetical protein
LSEAYHYCIPSLTILGNKFSHTAGSIRAPLDEDVKGIIALAYESSTSLCNFLEAIRDAPKLVLELKDEAVVLKTILQSLQQIEADEENAFVCLRLLLWRCGAACRDFEAIARKIISNDTQTSRWRVWAELKYMGEDITAFRHEHATYKATICIAINDATL